MRIRTLLGRSDAELLRGFTAFMRPRGWEVPVAEIIELLPDMLEAGRVSAIGIFDGDNLEGVAAWAVAPDRPGLWICHLVAVRFGRQRHGLGGRLKAALVSRARQEGARLITSIVHVDNRAMIKLNESLGAIVRPAPDDPMRKYYACVIDLASTIPPDQT